ncbi:hypothetical protein MKX07_005355 [Trichoderma sp. CBMAI-0711]|nr:hypothetical protein MKX07_005355 [Trichoderma sp. CBMAI-0711]
MSEPFSAGQHWCCFELVAPDDESRFLIARVRLPKHPENIMSVPDEADEYLIQCEVATMKFLQAKVTAVPIPRLYAYEAPGSARAIAAGAAYMLIEGFHGNSLQDVNLNIYNLPISTQEHIFAQWTTFQAQLAALTFPRIGSISHFSQETGPVIGPMATSWLEHLPSPGPFDSTWAYFAAVAEGFVAGALQSKQSAEDDESESSYTNRFAILGPLVFQSIVRDTDIYQGDQGPFPLTHMDMGAQNLLVDDDYNLIAVIDWEFAQSAPWQVFHYPMPIAITTSDTTIAQRLHDGGHLAHRNVSRQVGARLLYRQQFQEAERGLEEKGYALRCSIADVLESKASRIYGLVEKIGSFTGLEEELTYELVRLGYGLKGLEAEQLTRKVEADFKAEKPDYFQ